MNKQTLVDKLGSASSIDELINISNEAGKSLSYEEADQLLGRIMQTKNDAAELSGDTVEVIAKEVFNV